MNTVHILSAISLKLNEDGSIKFDDKVSIRNIGVFEDKETAEIVISESSFGNYKDTNRLVVIEEVKVGTKFPHSQSRSWYKWSTIQNCYILVSEDSELESYRKIGCCFFD